METKLYLITSLVEAGAFETLPVTPFMELISHNDILKSDWHFGEHQKICVTSEYSLEVIGNRIDANRRNAMEALKDKYNFRKILSGLYPDFYFRQVKLQDIKGLKIDRKSVIKPARGCFGTAVRVIDADIDCNRLSSELEAELKKNSKVYSDFTLSKQDFLLEDYIEGQEYAVDMFYNAKGEACIVNLYHHPMPENKAYLHMLYNSSKRVFDDIYTPVKDFLSQLNKILNVTNFVMHVEVKLIDGKVFPIEINPLRIGGMGLGNLVFYSLGINPYTCFINDSEPDWNEVWKGKEKDVFTFFIAYNATSKPVNLFKPNPAKLKRQFTQMLHEQPFNYQRQLAFGIYFLRETEENIRRLQKIEFDDFFEEL
jgi:hypothetical protein